MLDAGSVGWNYSVICFSCLNMECNLSGLLGRFSCLNMECTLSGLLGRFSCLNMECTLSGLLGRFSCSNPVWADFLATSSFLTLVQF